MKETNKLRSILGKLRRKKKGVYESCSWKRSHTPLTTKTDHDALLLNVDPGENNPKRTIEITKRNVFDESGSNVKEQQERSLKEKALLSS